MFWNKTQKVITHGGSFHADEVVGVSTLKLVFGEIEVTRTRDKKTIEEKDAETIVLDVGFTYDESRLIFDHHQPGFDMKRDNGVPYASAGLIWKYFGMKLCKDTEVWQRVDEKIIQSIDADDCGISVYEKIGDFKGPYTLPHLVESFKPTFNETFSHDEQFHKAVEIVTKVLEREIIRAHTYIEGRDIVREKYEKADDKRFIVIEKIYSYQDVLGDYPEPLYVVGNDGIQPTWFVKCINVKGETFKSRKLLPESWAGKNGKDFEAASGVAGVNFCHKDRFMAVANSKDAAIQLVKIAIETV